MLKHIFEMLKNPLPCVAIATRRRRLIKSCAFFVYAETKLTIVCLWPHFKRGHGRIHINEE